MRGVLKQKYWSDCEGKDFDVFPTGVSDGVSYSAFLTNARVALDSIGFIS